MRTLSSCASRIVKRFCEENGVKISLLDSKKSVLLMQRISDGVSISREVEQRVSYTKIEEVLREMKNSLDNSVMLKEVWEGWKVKDFVDELEPLLDMIQSGQAIIKPLKSRKELAKWCKENQPNYKKEIPEVVDYFSKRYRLG